jgi:hypothetical protein
MSFAPDRAASRFGRDRDLLPDAAPLGPYETPYDVRRGYQQPLRRTRRRDLEPETAFFLGRMEDDGPGEVAGAE